MVIETNSGTQAIESWEKLLNADSVAADFAQYPMAYGRSDDQRLELCVGKGNAWVRVNCKHSVLRGHASRNCRGPNKRRTLDSKRIWIGAQIKIDRKSVV